jgi:hypothetical protein
VGLSDGKMRIRRRSRSYTYPSCGWQKNVRTETVGQGQTVPYRAVLSHEEADCSSARSISLRLSRWAACWAGLGLKRARPASSHKPSSAPGDKQQELGRRSAGHVFLWQDERAGEGLDKGNDSASLVLLRKIPFHEAFA